MNLIYIRRVVQKDELSEPDHKYLVLHSVVFNRYEYMI